MTKVNVRPIEAFELVDQQGKTIAVARVTDRWEGMARLSTDDGQSLIVEDISAFAVQFGKSFAQIFGGSDGNGTHSLRVYKASPDLAARLGLLAAPSDISKVPTA